MSSPWTFVAWGMDVIGPIEPKASNGHMFILVAIDYFTKRVEAVTFKSVTKKVVVDFIHFNIICRFGIPKVIITDNAANVNSHLMQELPFALLGYRTTVRTIVGATPYSLVYGTEAVIPAEFEIPSLRIVVEAEIDDDEWIKTRYNKKVRPRHFEEGQLVLRRILPHHAKTKGKFSPNWKGLFVVKRVLPNGALYLADIEGKVKETLVNADAVKRYYI
ncbi:uncharacterized protein LOC107001384 [Solanum pennellii]|uniref:Uncharacterized protein LOC107001384 n=1 Tax=Solanum pennellii TaxID=28526 RepID=A0ABM1FCJ6_SOLPN|nr:uncharacterized protein LOC107001384 [Solanum pennellii]